MMLYIIKISKAAVSKVPPLSDSCLTTFVI